MKDYGGFTRDFSSQMLYGANEVELGKQWSNNKLLTSLSEKYDVLGCLRRDLHVTVLYKQKSNSIPGEYLGRLVLGVEGKEIKVFGIIEGYISGTPINISVVNEEGNVDEFSVFGKKNGQYDAPVVINSEWLPGK